MVGFCLRSVERSGGGSFDATSGDQGFVCFFLASTFRLMDLSIQMVFELGSITSYYLKRSLSVQLSGLIGLDSTKIIVESRQSFPKYLY